MLLPSHGEDNNFISKPLRFPELINVTLLFLCPSHDGRVEEKNTSIFIIFILIFSDLLHYKNRIATKSSFIDVCLLQK